MSFADKKGITVASGFKLQAKALLDARQQVDTIAERDELVTIGAATEGLIVYVKANHTAYVYNGTGWDSFSTGDVSITVDSVLSETSTNPLQNKTVTAELGKKLNASVKGAAGGVAELGADGKVPASQLPSYVDDVVEGYLSGGKFYVEAAHTTEITGESGKIYVDLTSSKTYRWSGSAYVVISDTIALGETAQTAYRGDRGKIAYDHSQSAHAPANAEANVQSDWSVTDEASDAFIKNKPTSMRANGGNADTVGGHTVGVNVPANAAFTDTTYDPFDGSADGLVPAPAGGVSGILASDGTWAQALTDAEIDAICV
ncbi:MAG: hypothetical protein Q4C60_07775 [Eubacteriales bacterium]|nr:hypothetical protein [Eubacteriales bacterium]